MVFTIAGLNWRTNGAARLGVTVAAFSSSAWGAYTDDFNTDASGNYNVGYQRTLADASANFAFDYFTLGVGLAPGTTDGSTTGVLLKTHLQDGAAPYSGVSITPNNFTDGGNNYVLTYDAYLAWPGGNNYDYHMVGGIGTDPTMTNLPSAFSSFTPASNLPSTAPATSIFGAYTTRQTGTSRNYKLFSGDGSRGELINIANKGLYAEPTSLVASAAITPLLVKHRRPEQC